MAVVAGVFLAARGGRSPAVKSVDFPAGEGPRTEVLVSPQWVHAAQVYQEDSFRGEPPARWGANRLVVVEAAWVPPGKRAAYDRGHVPGAVLLNTEDLETGYPAWQLRPLADLQLAIGRVGITPETTVVVYARSLLAAARVWWVLSYAGVKDVRLMDGGWNGWQQAGYPIETIERPVAAVDFAAEPRSRWLMTTDEMRERVGRSDLRLGDVRSVEEFAGRASGYSTLDARGRIPGAIHLGDADDASPLYRSRDGRLRQPQDVLSLWQRQGLNVQDQGNPLTGEIVFYCGGGWRSSLAFFYAWLLGVETPRNYSGGWVEWSTTYHPDPQAGGSTPGWRQSATGHPVIASPQATTAPSPTR